MIDTVDIEKRAELTRAQAIQIGTTIGGITIANPSDLEIIAHRLARAKVAVPPHVRDNAGVAFALCMQALEWKMPIMSVINKSYTVSNHGTERLAFESQLIHAVVERNAPIKGRLRHQIIGEGDERRCRVWATFKGEKTPHEYTSETLGTLREARGRNPDKGSAADKAKGGVVKGSPLWESQPEVQLFYSASRTWARMFCPDVILGAYTPDDPWYSSDNMRDVTPQIEGLAQRLKDARKEAAANESGFDVDHVRKVIEGEAKEQTSDDQSEHAKHADRSRERAMVREGGPIGDSDKERMPGSGEKSEGDRADVGGQDTPTKDQKASAQEDRPDSPRGRSTQIPRSKGRR